MKNKKNYEAVINSMIDYIQQNLGTDITLSKLSDRVHFSKYHLHRIFKEYTGETLKKYIRRLRMENSVNMMIQEDKSLSEVAVENGYSWISNFSRTFRKYFKIPPRNLKQLLCTEYGQLSFEETGIKNIEIKQTDDIFYRYKRFFMDYRILTEVMKNDVFCESCSEVCQKTFGIIYDNPQVTPADKCRFDLCFIKNSGNSECTFKDIYKSGSTDKILKRGMFACFDFCGNYEKLIKAYEWVFLIWPLQKRVKLKNAPVYEFYRKSKDQKHYIEIRVPLEI